MTINKPHKTAIEQVVHGVNDETSNRERPAVDPPANDRVRRDEVLGKGRPL